MKITDNLLTINPMTRSAEKLENVKKIVVHYVGNPNTTALANRNYFESLSKQTEKYASSHYIVGLDGEIMRCIPENEVAWHSGNIDMNRQSIGIENCHPDDTGKFNDLTYNSLIDLLVDLCKRYNLDPQTDIIRHYDVTGKDCPKYYVENQDAWDKLKNDVSNEMVQQLVVKYIVTPKIGLNCRENPEINSKKVTAYKYNDVIEINQIENGWGRTKDGWVSMDYVTKYSEDNEQLKRYIVTPKIGLNCRENPEINSKKITAYKYNEVIEISKIENSWGRTKDGWVSMNYVTKYSEDNEQSKRYIVTARIGLNCRNSNSIFAKKVLAYKYNEIIEISETKNDWGRTKDGWVNMNYVKSI